MVINIITVQNCFIGAVNKSMLLWDGTNCVVSVDAEDLQIYEYSEKTTHIDDYRHYMYSCRSS